MTFGLKLLRSDTAGLVDRAEDRPLVILASNNQARTALSIQVAVLAALADQVGQDPMVLSLLQTLNCDGRQLSPPQTATQQESDQGVIA